MVRARSQNRTKGQNWRCGQEARQWTESELQRERQVGGRAGVEQAKHEARARQAAGLAQLPVWNVLSSCCAAFARGFTW